MSDGGGGGRNGGSGWEWRWKSGGVRGRGDEGETEIDVVVLEGEGRGGGGGRRGQGGDAVAEQRGEESHVLVGEGKERCGEWKVVSCVLACGCCFCWCQMLTCPFPTPSSPITLTCLARLGIPCPPSFLGLTSATSKSIASSLISCGVVEVAGTEDVVEGLRGGGRIRSTISRQRSGWAWK